MKIKEPIINIEFEECNNIEEVIYEENKVYGKSFHNIEITNKNFRNVEFDNCIFNSVKFIKNNIN